MTMNASLWMSQLKPCDIVVSLDHKGIASWFQNLYRKKITKAKHSASHAFIVTDPPKISEAEGRTVHSDTIEKYLTDHHTVWVFRYKGMRNEQIGRMRAFVNGSEQSGGTYAWGGIFEFVKKFFRLKKKTEDERGVFCSEYISRAILAGGLPFIKDKSPWQITPSVLLSWFIEEAPDRWWALEKYFKKGAFSA